MTDQPIRSRTWEYKNYYINQYSLLSLGLTQLKNRNDPTNPYGKAGFILGWPETEPNTDLSADDFPHNYGVVLNAEYFVLDWDPRHKGIQAGDNPYQRLCLDLGYPNGFDTFTVFSGRGDGGKHDYFKKPPGMNLKSKLEGYPGVEIKKRGNLVVGPGSTHPITGDYYLVEQNEHHLLEDIPEAPESLLLMLERTEEFIGEGILTPLDDGQTRERFLKWLQFRQPAITGAGASDWVYQTSAFGRDMGLSEAVTAECLLADWNSKNSPPIPPGKIYEINRNAFAYAKGAVGSKSPQAQFDALNDGEDPLKQIFSDDDQQYQDLCELELLVKADWDWTDKTKTKLTAGIKNILIHFKLYPYKSYPGWLFNLFKYNKFTDCVELTRKPPWNRSNEKDMTWGNDDVDGLMRFFSCYRNWNLRPETVKQAVRQEALQHKYHPIHDYYNSLVWDGIDRIEKLFIDYAGVEANDYTRAVGRCYIIGMVARAMDPGCQMDNMVILEGPQGQEKSKFLEALGGGPDYYASLSIDVSSKDSLGYCHMYHIIEVAELCGLKTADVNARKNFITTKMDTIRRPYKEYAEKRFRQFVLAATTNEDQYLRDQTGDRRSWPVRCTRINLEALKRDRDQLFAEAYHKYLRGEPWYIHDERVERLAKIEQAARLEHEPWADEIAGWLADQRAAVTRLSSAFIRSEILNITASRSDFAVNKRIAAAMQSLGWVGGKYMFGKAQQRGFEFKGKVNWEEFTDGI